MSSVRIRRFFCPEVDWSSFIPPSYESPCGLWPISLAVSSTSSNTCANYLIHHMPIIGMTATSTMPLSTSFGSKTRIMPLRKCTGNSWPWNMETRGMIHHERTWISKTGHFRGYSPGNGDVLDQWCHRIVALRTRKFPLT